MKNVMDQDAVGACAFVDVLEEAALRKGRVQVELRTGERFTDDVVDVTTHHGANWAVFRERGEVATADIRTMTRAQA